MLEILFWLVLGFVIGLLVGQLRVSLIKTYLQRLKEMVDRAHIKNHHILQSERKLSILEERMIKEQNQLFSQLTRHFHKLNDM